MKNLLVVTLILYFSVFSFQASVAQQAESGIQELGQELITALQSNDVDSYLKVHLTPTDLEEFNKKSASISQKSKQNQNDAEEALEGIEESSKSNFEEVIQKGITDQINWKEVNYTGMDNIAQMKKEGDLYIIHNPVVRFTYKEKEYKLRIDKITKLDRGWVVVDNVNLE
jgi:hypothetical protein